MARRWLIVILLTLSFLSACNNATDTSTTPSSSSQAHFQFVENTTNSAQKNYHAKNSAATQVYEGQSNHTNYFELALSSPLTIDASVSYQTRDGTAKAGEDYIATSGTATIPAGETRVLIGVEIIADSLTENNETFSLVISNPVGASFPPNVTEIVATHTIMDNNITLPPAPQNLQATAGNQQITFTWDAVTNADSYTLYVAEEPNFTPDNYAAHNGGQMFPNVTSPYIVTGLTAGNTYYALLTANLNERESPPSTQVSATLPNANAALDEIALVSVSSAGEQGNDWSDEPSISTDGRYITFTSQATNLVDNDTNGDRDIFVHDRQTGQTARVSVSSTGEQGNGRSTGSSISADGRYITFASEASNLVDNDTNGSWDIFVHDRQTGQTTRVSVSNTGAQGYNHSFEPNISADGRYITFKSSASLVDNDTNGKIDIFVHDRQTGQTTRVSVSSAGEQGNERPDRSSISADGRYITFESNASNLVDNDTNDDRDIFVHDRQTGQTTRVSVSRTGEQGNGESNFPSISADGRYITFHSHATNLVDNDTNDYRDIFVHDRQTGQTTRVSVSSTGAQGNQDSRDSSISADGRYIAFHSWANNLVDNDTNGTWDVFVHDRETGQTTLVSVSRTGEQGNNASARSSISADGRYIAFYSWANNLVDNDTNGFFHDIFVAPNPLFNTN